MLLVRFEEVPEYRVYDRPALPDTDRQAWIDSISSDLQRWLGDKENGTLFMIFDALVANIATILDNLYLRLGSHIHYMGVNAGSETFKPIPCLFDGKKVFQGAFLAVFLKDHKGTLLEHGYRAPEETIIATSTDGNRIRHIDWKPAFEVYCERVKSGYNVAINRENFYRYAVHFPFGIMRIDGEVLVRIPVALEEDGSLFCVGEIPPHSLLTLLESPEEDSLNTVKALTAGLKKTGRENLLLFYCAGRRMHLGPGAREELTALNELSGSANLAGALSLGEIGSSKRGGYPLFHNAAIVLSEWEV